MFKGAMCQTVDQALGNIHGIVDDHSLKMATTFVF